MNRLDLSTPWGVTLALLPEVILTAWTLVVLLVVSWRHDTAEDSRLAGWLSFVGVLLSAAGLAALWVNGVVPDGLAQMVALDPYRYAAVGISLLAAGATDYALFVVTRFRDAYRENGGNVQAAMAVYAPKPVYPPLAKQARIQGVARFNVIIGKDGTVQDIQVASGHPLLVEAALDAVRQIAKGRVYLGGHSYGSRQATMLAAANAGVADALLLLSYPLHPPRRLAELRTSHFPQLLTPALFVHGSRDPFGTLDEMRAALALIPAPTELVEVEGAGHDLKSSGAVARALKHFLAFTFSRYNSDKQL